MPVPICIRCNSVYKIVWYFNNEKDFVMNMLSKSIVSACFSVLTFSAFAGGPVHVPAQNEFPTGFYAGIGGGYNSLADSFSKTLFDGLNFASFTASANGLAPLVQVGFWGRMGSSMAWGVKASYSYLNLDPDYILSDSSGVYSNFDAGVKNQFNALATLGFGMDKYLAYVGVGVSVLPTNFVAQAAGAAGGNYKVNETFVDALVQLGMTYNINSNWFVDSSYSYAFGGTKTLSQTVGGNPFKTNLRVSNQTAVVTINRRFFG